MTVLFRRLDVASMLVSDPPPVRWIAEPLIAAGALTVLVGDAGAGKSLLSMALAVGVATARPVAQIPVMPGRALMIDAENAESEIHRRIRAFDLPQVAAERLPIVVPDGGFDLRRHTNALDGVIAEHAPTVVVLDSFRSLWSGSENEPHEVAPVLDRMRTIAHQRDVAVVLLHHRSRLGGVRGSTAIEAAADLVWDVGRDDGDEDRTRRVLTARKFRLGPEPDRLYISIGNSGGRVTITRAEATDDHNEPPRARQRVIEELAPLIVNALKVAPAGLTRSEVAKACRRPATDRAVGRALDHLVTSRTVTRHGDLYQP